MINLEVQETCQEDTNKKIIYLNEDALFTFIFFYEHDIHNKKGKMLRWTNYIQSNLYDERSAKY